MIRRIHFIYERATRKFKADLQLWLKWVEFCKRSDSPKQLSKVGNWNGQGRCPGSPLQTNIYKMQMIAPLPAADSEQQGLLGEKISQLSAGVSLPVPKPLSSGLT